MSSDDELNDFDGTQIAAFGEERSAAAKKRKITRACDVCRKKKIACDAPTKTSNSKCSHCMAYKLDCTFLQRAQKRTPPKGYIDDLEKRVELLEKLIRKCAPQVDIDREVGPSFNKDTWAKVAANRRGVSVSTTSVSTPHLFAPALPPTTGMSTMPLATAAKDDQSSDDEKFNPAADGSLTERLESRVKNLSIGGPRDSFFGKSSGVTLVEDALNLRQQVTGVATRTRATLCSFRVIRPKYWRPNPWEWMTAPIPSVLGLKFPPPDLILHLVNCCFDEVIAYLPILHRPTFMRQLQENKHRSEVEFAWLLLLVCAVGARYCRDTRVCLVSPEGNVEWGSAGWFYFSQVDHLRRPLIGLADLQLMVLKAVYLGETSAPNCAWVVAGVGLRLVQDIGAHRERLYSPKENQFENQMWKRSFWSLSIMDTWLSSVFGRPIGISDQDIDVDYPLEVDDDGWDENTKQWVQPTGKPSHLTYFKHLAKLLGIMSRTIRTLYAVNKRKAPLGAGADWQQTTVAELDSALNQWLEALPEHLKWTPQIEDGPFSREAAVLRVTFHYVQITTHRPFISSKQSSLLSLPSLAISANAARSTSNVLESCLTFQAPPMVMFAAFISGVILMINIWDSRRRGLKVDDSSDVANVRKCLRYLKHREETVHLAGRLHDILQDTAFHSAVFTPPSSNPTLPESLGSSGNSVPHRRDNSAAASSVLGNPSEIGTLTADGLTGLTSTTQSPSSIGTAVDVSEVPSTRPTHDFSLGMVNPQSAVPPPPVTMPMSGVYSPPGTNPPMVGDGWEAWHIAGGSSLAGASGQILRMPEFVSPSSTGEGPGSMDMSPDTFLNELLAPLAGGESLGVDPQSGFWDMQLPDQWNWMIGLQNAQPAHQ